MKKLVTFKGVADALREAEEMRARGEIQQVTDSWVDPYEKPVGACAAGGIALVCGWPTVPMMSWELRVYWPILTQDVVNPDTGEPGELLGVISNLNEISTWTWSMISDWLESLDRIRAPRRKGELE